MTKNMTHSEVLYALRRQGRGPVPSEMAYLLSRSVRQLWRRIIEEEFLGSAQTVESLRRQGWRAVKVHVQEIDV